MHTIRKQETSIPWDMPHVETIEQRTSPRKVPNERRHPKRKCKKETHQVKHGSVENRFKDVSLTARGPPLAIHLAAVSRHPRVSYLSAPKIRWACEIDRVLLV